MDEKELSSIYDYFDDWVLGVILLNILNLTGTAVKGYEACKLRNC